MIKYLIPLLVSIAIMSCSPTLTPFTQQLYERHNWNDAQLKKIQFYLSEDIVLSREVGMNESIIDKGAIKIENGRQVEQVIFKKGTPGVFVFSPKDNKFGISFEKEDSKYLMFGPNPKMSERYVLMGRDWANGQGQITYNNKVYTTTAQSAYVSLLVDLKKAEKTFYNAEVASGRRVQ